MNSAIPYHVPRPMHASYLTLALMLILVGALLYATVTCAMAQVLLRPPRMTDAKAIMKLRRLTPGDLDIPFQDVTFHVRDESTGRPLKLCGWWMPLPAGGSKCALILHGYSDAKVGAIAWAPLLRSFGFHVLAIDLRAHGESEGVYTTAGFWERHDVNQVIDQFRAARPEQTRQLLVFGVSLGAAVAAAVGAMRDDLAAVVLECPYADFRHAVRRQANRLGMPGPIFQRATLKLAQRLAECDFGEVAPARMVPVIRAPLMIVQSCDDPFVSEADRKALAAAVASRPAEIGPSVHWQIEDCHHVIAMAVDPQEYRRRLESFLRQAIPEPQVLPSVAGEASNSM